MKRRISKIEITTDQYICNRERDINGEKASDVMQIALMLLNSKTGFDQRIDLISESKLSKF